MVADVRMSSLTYITSHYSDLPVVLVGPSSDTLPFRKCVFDLILCVQVPDLTENDIDFFPKVRDLLKVDGKLIVTVTNRVSYKYLFRRFIRKESGDGGCSLAQTRVYHYSLSEIVTRAESAGLVTRFQYGYNWIPFLKASNSRLIGLTAKIEGMLKVNRLPCISPWVMCCFQKK